MSDDERSWNKVAKGGRDDESEHTECVRSMSWLLNRAPEVLLNTTDAGFPYLTYII